MIHLWFTLPMPLASSRAPYFPSVILTYSSSIIEVLYPHMLAPTISVSSRGLCMQDVLSLIFTLQFFTHNHGCLRSCSTVFSNKTCAEVFSSWVGKLCFSLKQRYYHLLLYCLIQAPIFGYASLAWHPPGYLWLCQISQMLPKPPTTLP